MIDARSGSEIPQGGIFACFCKYFILFRETCSQSNFKIAFHLLERLQTIILISKDWFLEEQLCEHIPGSQKTSKYLQI